MQSSLMRSHFPPCLHSSGGLSGQFGSSQEHKSRQSSQSSQSTCGPSSEPLPDPLPEPLPEPLPREPLSLASLVCPPVGPSVGPPDCPLFPAWPLTLKKQAAQLRQKSPV